MRGGKFRDEGRVYCDTDVEGKHTGKDAQENKCTSVSLYGLDQARKAAKTYTERAADSIKNDENAAIFLKTLAQRALVRVQ